MFDKTKDFFLHKITLRIMYIAVAFISSHLMAFLATPKSAEYLSSIGVVFQVTDEQKFKTALTLLFLMIGEFIYRFTHTKVIMPLVKKQAESESATESVEPKIEEEKPQP